MTSKNKKYDRNRRNPQNAAYKMEKRAEVHRTKRIKKHAIFMLACKTKIMKVLRGTARALRRGGKTHGHSTNNTNVEASSF